MELFAGHCYAHPGENERIVHHRRPFLRCAIANDVANVALDLGAQNFKLIALDGFRPCPELLLLPGTTVWSAECNGARSLNYDDLRSCKKFRVYHAEVTEQWPLHFSLVNINV